jgi:hypothetical protein
MPGGVASIRRLSARAWCIRDLDVMLVRLLASDRRFARCARVLQRIDFFLE